LGSRV